MNTRQTNIIQMLGQNERIDVADLARQFDVAEMTIRRDLTDLEKKGFLVRTHGGAVSAGRTRFLQRAFPHYSVSPEKEAIGKMAASLVKPGQTIMVDRGTTALEVSLHLSQDAGITVVTSSLCVAQALFGSPVDVLLLGGYLSKDFPSLYGPLTETMLESLHVDILFIGCDGAHSIDGLYAADLHIAKFQHAMMGIADKVVVVTESHKFKNKSFARYGQWNEVNTLITDPGLSPSDQANLNEYDIELLMAKN
ncbi:MAG: DeoR/GlpR family DNA-binding transcription regulator [Armatimonadetes bacterium]|nr:DeoR/GlpR family DNA-binding transcription regulator [Armatimonadota bacterium]